MSDGETGLLVSSFIFIGGVVLCLFLLNVVWLREEVRKDLRRKGFVPIQVRWRPFAGWAVYYSSTLAFRTMSVDATGCIQTARCAVHTWFHSVYWVGNDVTYLDKNTSRIGRLFYMATAIFLLGFGLKHLATGILVLPPSARQIYPRPIHLHGWPVILLSLAALCGAVNLLTNVCFRSSGAETKRRWTWFARGFSILGWVLFWASLAVYAYQVSSR